MIEKTTTTSVTGLSNGHVTCQKRCQPLAPAREAASCRSVLMVCSPASSVIAKKGMPRQVLTAMAHHIPYTPLERNGILSTMKPVLKSSQFRTLKVGSNIQRH